MALFRPRSVLSRRIGEGCPKSMASGQSAAWVGGVGRGGDQFSRAGSSGSGQPCERTRSGAVLVGLVVTFTPLTMLVKVGARRHAPPFRPQTRHGSARMPQRSAAARVTARDARPDGERELWPLLAGGQVPFPEPDSDRPHIARRLQNSNRKTIAKEQSSDDGTRPSQLGKSPVADDAATVRQVRHCEPETDATQDGRTVAGKRQHVEKSQHVIPQVADDTPPRLSRRLSRHCAIGRPETRRTRRSA